MRKALIATSLFVLAASTSVRAQPGNAPPTPPQDPYDGQPTTPGPPPPPVPPPVDDAQQQAQDIFDRSFIVFEDEYDAMITLHDHGYSAHGTVTTMRRGVPVRGVQREQLTPVEFYRGIGRADLAEDFQRGRRRKLIVGGVGVGAMIVGVGLIAFGFEKTFDGPQYENCDVFLPSWQACLAEEDRRFAVKEAEARKWYIGGGIALVAGLALGTAYRYMNPHPATESERRVMAHDYNERLRRDLRLPRPRRMSLSPFVTTDGGGFLAAGQF